MLFWQQIAAEPMCFKFYLISLKGPLLRCTPISELAAEFASWYGLQLTEASSSLIRHGMFFESATIEHESFRLY